MPSNLNNQADQRRASLLREMGLAPLWRLRCQDNSPSSLGVSEVATAPVSPLNAAIENKVGAGRSEQIDRLDWPSLRARIRDCRACELCRERKQAVPGIGDEAADWLFVGEGPGEEEDQRGEPFVGPAGKLLDAMLAAMDLERGKNVYIANAIKCRPPGNKTPSEEQISACRPYLDRQISLLEPRLIVALGRAAAEGLLGQEINISQTRGKRLQTSSGIPVIVTYHPAYLLRNPTDKAKAWEDLCFAKRTFQLQQGSMT